MMLELLSHANLTTSHWDAVEAIGSAFGALAGGAAAGLAALAINSARKEQARHNASGLHGTMYLQRVEPADESGEWDVIVKVSNSSQHPYFGVVASVALLKQGRRVAARAEVVAPGSTRYASVGSIDGCDVTALRPDTQVLITFRDSRGHAWERGTDGRLRAVGALRELWLRLVRARYVDPSMRLHGLTLSMDPHLMDYVDRAGLRAEVCYLRDDPVERQRDRAAQPPRFVDVEERRRLVAEELTTDDGEDFLH